jgi:tRNA dimethylallyltransferase
MDKIITLLGPTAAGKTKLAVALAVEINAEIISADSRQVYRNMDIGTGKDLADYHINGQKIPYHLIDILEAGEKYNVFQFQKDFQVCLDLITSKNKQAILCGGSGQYISSVLQDFKYTAVPVDESLRAMLDEKEEEELIEIYKKYNTDFSKIAKTESKKRLIRAIEINTYLAENKEFNPTAFKRESIIFGLDLPVELRREKINTRLNERLESGLIEEVETLLKSGLEPETLLYYGLEYKFIVDYLLDRYDFDTFVILLQTAIHQFAKRQMTYFRKIEKDGNTIHWIDATLPIASQLLNIQEILEKQKMTKL